MISFATHATSLPTIFFALLMDTFGFEVGNDVLMTYGMFLVAMCLHFVTTAVGFRRRVSIRSLHVVAIFPRSNLSNMDSALHISQELHVVVVIWFCPCYMLHIYGRTHAHLNSMSIEVHGFPAPLSHTHIHTHSFHLSTVSTKLSIIDLTLLPNNVDAAKDSVVGYANHNFQ